MYKLLLYCFLFFFIGCNTNEKKADKSAITLERNYIERQAQGNDESFIHYLALEGSTTGYDNMLPVLKKVQEYYDTCNTKKPIAAICIIRKNKDHIFESGEPNYQQVYKDALLELYFDKNDLEKVFPVKKLSFFENGEHKEIDIKDFMNLVNERKVKK